MVQILIGETPVEVDDAIMDMTPEQQAAEVEDIAEQMGLNLPQDQQDAMAQMSAATQDPAAGVAQKDYDDWAKKGFFERGAQAVGDVAHLTGRGAASLVTGLADAVSGFQGGMTPEDVSGTIRSKLGQGSLEDMVAEEKLATQGARNRAGWAGTAAEAVPSAMLPMAMPAEGIIAKPLAAAAQGVPLGAVMAAGNGEDPITGAIVGGVAGAGGQMAGDAIVSGLSGVAGLVGKAAQKLLPEDMLPAALHRTPMPEMGTEASLRTAAQQAFGEAERYGVLYNENAVESLQRRAINDFKDVGFDPGNEDGAAIAFKALRDAMNGEKHITLRGLQTLREKVAGGMRNNMTGKDPAKNNMLVGQILDGIDDLIEAPSPAFMAPVHHSVAQQAGAAHQKGRQLWRQMRKLQEVTKLIDSGEIQGARNISQNTSKTVKGKLATIVDPMHRRGKYGGYTATEKAAARKAVTYGGAEGIAHAASGLLPTGKLTGAQLGMQVIGGVLTGGAHIVPQALAQGALMGAGYLAKRATDAMAKKSIADFVSVVARGEIPETALRNTLQRMTQAKRQAVTQALAAAGVSLGTAAPTGALADTVEEAKKAYGH